MDASLRVTFGDSLCDAVARRLDSISKHNGLLETAGIKFVSEAIIASSLAGGERARRLNARLGETLYDRPLATLLLGNPRTATMFALPLCFLAERPPGADAVAALFCELHEAGATKALSYPSYRNLEMDYIHAKLTGRSFRCRPFDGLKLAFPWMTRDQVYGLTHAFFYDSDFCRRTVRSSPEQRRILDALLSKACHQRDSDVLLELILCRTALEGRAAQESAVEDRLVRDAVHGFLDREGRVNRELEFERHYHQLFLAWIYVARREGGCAPIEHMDEVDRLASLGRLMISIGGGDPLEAFAAYADHSETFGLEPILETVLELYGRLTASAVNAVARTEAPLRLAAARDAA